MDERPKEQWYASNIQGFHFEKKEEREGVGEQPLQLVSFRGDGGGREDVRIGDLMVLICLGTFSSLFLCSLFSCGSD